MIQHPSHAQLSCWSCLEIWTPSFYQTKIRSNKYCNWKTLQNYNQNRFYFFRRQRYDVPSCCIWYERLIALRNNHCAKIVKNLSMKIRMVLAKNSHSVYFRILRIILLWIHQTWISQKLVIASKQVWKSLDRLTRIFEMPITRNEPSSSSPFYARSSFHWRPWIF